MGKVLLARARRYDYNSIFGELCDSADINCIMVEGGVKGVGTEHGDQVEVTNSWCLVFVDGFWGFVDQRFGSTSSGNDHKHWEVDVSDIEGYQPDGQREQRFGINEAYFLPSPAQFVYDHFCQDSAHQLLPRPVTDQEFQRMAFLSDFDQNIVDLSQPKCILETDTGEVELTFDIHEDSFVKFNFVLLKRRGTITHPRGEDNLKNYVAVLNNGDRKTVLIEFEYIGTYILEVFITDIKSRHSYELASYLIKCTRPKFDPVLIHLASDQQELGPGADWKLLKIKAEQEGGLLKTEEGKIKLVFHRENNDEVDKSFQIFGLKSKEEERRAMLYQQNTSSTILNLRMPTHGKHVLRVSTRPQSQGRFTHTDYLLTSEEACMEPAFSQDPKVRGRVGQMSRERLLETISHLDALISNESTDDMKILMKKKEPNVELGWTFQLDEEDGSKRDVSHFAFLYDSNGDVRFDLLFPQSGTYHLSIGSSDGAATEESFHYLIEANKPSTQYLPFPSRQEAWSPSFTLHSPTQGELKQNEHVNFDVEIPGKILFVIVM